MDLGGTNFRVLRCLLGGREGRVLKQEYEEVPIPKILMFGTSEELFDFIAKKLVDFVNREGDEYKPRGGRQQTVRELGLTFSFPVKQTSVRSGVLIQWSKGFLVADGVGADVVALLQRAINRQHGPKIEVVVLESPRAGERHGGHFGRRALLERRCDGWDDSGDRLSTWSGLGSGRHICHALMPMSSLTVRASTLVKRDSRK